MFDIIALAFAILFLLLLLQLRAIMAFTFDRSNVRWTDQEPAECIADLLVDMQEQLRELGFSGPRQLKFVQKTGSKERMERASIYCNHELHIVLWCHCPIVSSEANNPLMYWTTLGQDGRMLVSQAFDPFFQFSATDKLLAQTIDGASLKKQLQQHQQFIAAQKVSPDARTTSDTGVLYQGGDARNQNLRRMLEQGTIKADAQGVCRATFKSALKLFWLLLKRPKPAHMVRDVPTQRLLSLAQMQKVTRERAPTLAVQFAIFTGSVLLSIWIGALIWDAEFAIILLLVVIFHELGHFIAMRAFAYDNVHIMALPLVGGVTMGQDINPNAWRQAWIALMGPLPGIVLGWALLYWSLGEFTVDIELSPLGDIITVLLLVNYLNILPVLPLDGGHVLQALLPPKWLSFKAILILLTCMAGAYLAYLFNLYIFTLLALLQLLVIPGQLKTAGLVRKLIGRTELDRSQSYANRMLSVFATQEQIYGPCRKAPGRIAQAENILRIIDTKPMAGWQRSLISVLFAALLVVPFFSVLVGLMAASPMQDIAIYDVDAWDSREQMYRQQLRDMSITQIVADLHIEYGVDSMLTPTPENALRDKEYALGMELPKDLKAFYRAINEFTALRVLPVTAVTVADAVVSPQLTHFFGADIISVMDGENPENGFVELDKKVVKQWLLIGHVEDSGDFLLLEPDGEDHSGRLLRIWYDGASVHPSFRDWLEQYWMDSQENRFYRNQQLAETRQHYLQLQGLDIEELISKLKQQMSLPFWQEWLMNLFYQDRELLDRWPPPATVEVILASEQQLRRKLPIALTTLYRIHNGLPNLTLLPVQSVNRVSDAEEIIENAQYHDGDWRLLTADGAWQTFSFDVEDIQDCYVIGGIFPSAYQQQKKTLTATQLWCPNFQGYSVIDLVNARAYPEFKSYLRYIVASWK